MPVQALYPAATRKAILFRREAKEGLASLMRGPGLRRACASPRPSSRTPTAAPGVRLADAAPPFLPPL